MKGMYMDLQIRRSGARRRLIGSCVVLALGLLLLSACGGAGSSNSNGTGSANGSNTSSSQTSSMGNTTSTGLNNSTTPGNSMEAGSSTTPGSTMGTGLNGACEQSTKVTISEHTASNKEDQYTFTPDHVTLKTGQFITFSNQSDEVHVLVATPDASLVSSSIDRNEEQPVQFTKAGIYTLESQDAKHRASMQVTVTAGAGTTCGISASHTTVTFTGKHSQGQTDAYTLTPKTVSMSAGQSIALLNKTDQALNFSCKPSANIAEGNLRVDINEQQVVQFAKAGQYTCTSTESPRETLSVTVH